MRFDYYAATVREDEFGTYPDRLVTLLEAELRAKSVEVAKGRYGYDNSATLYNAERERLALVYYGGRNRWPHALGSGEKAPGVATAIRLRFPHGHLVTRADVCIDFDGEGCFDRLRSALVDVADRRDLKVTHAGDWHRLEDGRTVYVGSKSSPQYVRLYEKGKERQQVTGKLPEGVSVDLTRIELVNQPHKPAKRFWAASATEEEMWGTSLWTQEAARSVLDLDIARAARGVWSEPNDARTLSHLVRQYSALMAREAERQGGYPQLGRHLAKLFEREALARAGGKES